MPKVPHNSFYPLATFLFFIALVQFFLNSQPRAAAGFAVFGLLALLVGFAFPDRSTPAPKDEIDTKL